MPDDWVACPHCGERIERDAKSCRHCGSDDRTGWSDDTYMDGIDLPETGDYEDGLEREGFRKPARPPGRMASALVSAALILIFALWLLRGFFRAWRS
jgi:uncharacterized membrane protein YvbJ